MTKTLDPDTHITVSNMVRYIKCDRRIAAYVACSPEAVAVVRRNVPGLRGRPKTYKPCPSDTGDPADDARRMRADAERGSAELALRIARLWRPDAGARDVNPSASAQAEA